MANKTTKNDIAARVARYWLRNAEAMLKSGKTPTKLSEQHRMLVQEQAEADGVELTGNEVKTIARAAVKDAKFWLLQSDEFPTVKAWAIKRLMQ